MPTDDGETAFNKLLPDPSDRAKFDMFSDIFTMGLEAMVQLKVDEMLALPEVRSYLETIRPVLPVIEFQVRLGVCHSDSVKVVDVMDNFTEGETNGD